jgi:CRP-like cAMP-binding protein
MEQRAGEPLDVLSLQVLAHVEDLGDASAYADRIFELVGQSPFFAEFKREDIDGLSRYMRVYRAQAGQEILREGDQGDFMLLIVSGGVDIFKQGTGGARQLMTSVGPGMTLGEMSMVDGEPRFATCVATDAVLFAVLTRDAMANIIVEEPSLGTKILIVLVTMLTQRLRQTSARLLQYMERPLAF